MAITIQLAAHGGRRKATLTVDDAFADRPAADFVFDVLGAEDLDALAQDGVFSEADLPDMRAIQSAIFDRDEEGFFIRDGVSFAVNGRELNPDQPLAAVLTKVENEGLTSYRRVDLAVVSPAVGSNEDHVPAGPEPGREEQMRTFGQMLFLHQLARGFALDVTKEDPHLMDFVAKAEKDQLLDIDTARAVYVLSPAGRRLHDQWMEEAQELIKRFDIYGDVDMDSTGAVRFDSNLGEDWRVAAYELANVDPFKARFLIGLNDGEWDQLEGWQRRLEDEAFYNDIFAPVEAAPNPDDIGVDRLRFVMEEGNTVLRRDGVFL